MARRCCVRARSLDADVQSHCARDRAPWASYGSHRTGRENASGLRAHVSGRRALCSLYRRDRRSECLRRRDDAPERRARLARHGRCQGRARPSSARPRARGGSLCPGQPCTSRGCPRARGQLPRLLAIYGQLLRVALSLSLDFGSRFADDDPFALDEPREGTSTEYVRHFDVASSTLRLHGAIHLRHTATARSAEVGIVVDEDIDMIRLGAEIAPAPTVDSATTRRAERQADSPPPPDRRGSSSGARR